MNTKKYNYNLIASNELMAFTKVCIFFFLIHSFVNFDFKIPPPPGGAFIVPVSIMEISIIVVSIKL